MRPYPPTILVRAALVAMLALSFAIEVTAAEFDRSYEQEGISFRVRSANDSSLNRLTIETSGLKDHNSLVTTKVDGTVTNAEIADLDNNGFPEIYVYVHSAGSGAYGSLTAFAVDNDKSLSPIHLPALTGNPPLAEGYMGHDQFSIADDSLIQRFPVYRTGDTNARPTGGHRQLYYRLKTDAPVWILHLDRVELVEHD